MKNYRLIILAVLLTMVGRAMADNLTVDAVKMKAGETKQVAIGLSNPTHQYAAFQFDLVLPEGVSIAKNTKEKYIASLSEDRKDDHTLTVSDMGNNTYRFLTFSMTNAEFYGKDGALVNVTLKANDDISEGNKTATIQSQVFTEVNGTQHKWDNKAFQITIEAADVPVTLTAKSYSRVYGEENPAFEYTVSDGTIISGSPTISCSATATSPVGTYDIVIEKGSVSNGTVNLVKGTLTITKTPLTISAGNYTKKEGDDNPEFKASYSGFKNNETEAVLTKKPAITTTATKTSAAGEYPVKVSGAEAQNYDISYQNGILIIEKNYEAELAELENIRYGYEKMISEIQNVYVNLTADRVFIPEQKYSLDDTFYMMQAVMKAPYGNLSYYISNVESLTEQDLANIRNEYEEFKGKIYDGDSPLYTFPANLQSGSFSCSEGGCIRFDFDKTLEIRNETRTLYSFYPKAFSNNFNSKDPDFSISLIPDEGYKLVSLKVGGVETTKTTFDSFEAAEGFVATFEKETNSIDGTTTGNKSFDVYDLMGRKIKSNTDSKDDLEKGGYIINGRKAIKK